MQENIWQNHLIIKKKKLSKRGTKVNLRNLIDSSCEKPAANVILRGQE